jgi:hypothetical protein
MAATLRIDTLKFARKLTEAGLEPRVAEANVDGLADADTSDLAMRADAAALSADIAALGAATKAEAKALAADIAALGAATKADTAALAADIVALRAATKADFAEMKAATKADLAELKAEMFRFMLVQSIGIVGLTVTLVKLLP